MNGNKVLSKKYQTYLYIELKANGFVTKIVKPYIAIGNTKSIYCKFNYTSSYIKIKTIPSDLLYLLIISIRVLT